MHRRLMFILLLFTVIVWGSFIGLAANDPEDMSNLPGFNEQEITGLGGLVGPDSMIRFSSKKELVLYDWKAKPARYVFLETTGKVVREIKVDFQGHGRVFALDPADRLYVLEQNLVINKKTKQINAVALKLHVYDDKGKKVKTSDLGKITGESLLINQMAVDAKGQVYLLRFGKNVTMYDHKGRMVKTLGPENCREMAMDTEGRLLLAGSSFLTKLDPATGRTIWKTDLVNILTYGLYYNPKDFSLYLLDTRGVRSYNAQGKFIGYVLDLRPHNIMNLNTRIDSLVLDEDKNFYISAIRNNHDKEFRTLIYKYSPAAVKSKSRQLLTVGGCEVWDERLMSIAANHFAQNHRDWTVQVSNEDIQKLNTELMAGKGPDIILFNDYDHYLKYIEKGLLIDVEPLMAGDREFHREEYFMNVLEGCRMKGKLFLIPLSIRFQAVVANPAVLKQEGIEVNDREWTWGDFYKMTEKVTRDLNGDGVIDRYALPKFKTDYLMYYCFNPVITGFMDEKKKNVGFSSPAFRDLLQQFKTVVERRQHPQYDFKDDVRKNDGLVTGEIVFSMESVNAIHQEMGSRDEKLAYLFLPGINVGEAKEPEFNVHILCGINRQAKNKDLAWEFIKLLLSEEMQSSRDLMYIPVNRKAFAIKEERDTQNLHPNYRKSSPEKNMAVIRRFLTAATRMVQPGKGEVEGIIRGEASLYIDGRKTLDEAVRVMQEKVEFYLDE